MASESEREAARGDRDSRGRWQRGCAGGPGRPRRAVEVDYLRVAIETVPLERWKRIVDAAAVLAEAGDRAAREWLGRLALGAEPPKLSRIASADARGVDAGDEVVADEVEDARLREELLASIRARPQSD